MCILIVNTLYYKTVSVYSGYNVHITVSVYIVHNVHITVSVYSEYNVHITVECVWWVQCTASVYSEYIWIKRRKYRERAREMILWIKRSKYWNVTFFGDMCSNRLRVHRGTRTFFIITAKPVGKSKIGRRGAHFFYLDTNHIEFLWKKFEYKFCRR